MDANGLRFWQVADAAGWKLSEAQGLHWRADARHIRLDSRGPAPSLAEDGVLARNWALKPSPVCDPGGSYAWWDGGAGTLRAAGFGHGATPLPLQPDDPPGLLQPTDLAFGRDDILYVARNGGVLLIDQRDRWPPARISMPGFAAHRLAPAQNGGVWALDRLSGRLARLTGVPLAATGVLEPRPERFEPVEPNPDPPELRVLAKARIPDGHEPIFIAASPGGQLALLAWRAGAEAVLFTLEKSRFVRRFGLAGLRFPYALAWVGEDRVAILATDGPRAAAQAFVYETDSPPSQAAVPPSGEVYPLLQPWNGGLFANALAEAPVYLTGDDPALPARLRPLRRLSRASYARSGAVTLGPFDSGGAGFVWHRLNLEAAVPDGTGLRIWATASDTAEPPTPPGGADVPNWSPHLVGGAATAPDFPAAPRAALCPEPSEFPFSPGLLHCSREPGRAGLFTVLLQRADRRVRRVSGRFLWLHVELLGDSRTTPEVAAIRVHGSRFAYRDQYLPELYREDLPAPDGDAEGSATPADFLDRFLCLFEGPLTGLEDRIASSWLLTDPLAAPESALPWLARWIGLDPNEAPARLRQALVSAPWTARLHGTLGGLMAALEIATGGKAVFGGRIDPAEDVPRPGQLALARLGDIVARVLTLAVAEPGSGGTTLALAGGGVTRGEIVAIEGWRLRRTFATILGADLADEDDPLTQGLAVSGNSFVGDSLILGDEHRREFLALFPGQLPSAADREAIAGFFERLAHRVLVLVRASSRTADAERLREVARTEAPAHVEVTFHAAQPSLIVGIASLVGIDSFLIPERQPARVRIGRSRLGAGDRIAGEGRLDRRGEGPASPRPIAVADGPAASQLGAGFLLSAARSQAGPGRRVARNIWTWT